ncbi:MAG TPA: hypothetical protein VM899_07760 [Rubellimicrobium sp.]|jgi:dihydroxy-acid dehydratase|nr:hypothetical protein [Rubellimicrobium sp.]
MLVAATANIPSIVLSGGPMLDWWYGGRLAGPGTIVRGARKLRAEARINHAQLVDMAGRRPPRSCTDCNTRARRCP